MVVGLRTEGAPSQAMGHFYSPPLRALVVPLLGLAVSLHPLQLGINYEEEGIMKLPQFFSALVLASSVFSVPVSTATAQSVIKITAPAGTSTSASFAPLGGEDPRAGVRSEERRVG